MLSAKWDLSAFLIIVVIVFSPPTIAADQDLTLPESQTLTGQLEILIADNFETGVSERRYAIRVKQADGGSRLVSLSFASIPPDRTLKSGEQVTVEGRLIGNTMAIDSLQRGPIDPSDGTMRAAGVSRSALSIGDRHAVVLILNMIDRRDDTDPGNDIAYNNTYEVSDLIRMMYTGDQNVKDLYDASSYGQLKFVPNTDGVEGQDVFGPYTIEFNSNDDLSINNSSLNSILNDWATQADDAARLAGINVDQYQHHIYFLPNQIYIDWVGMGTEGCPNNSCRAWVIKSNIYSDEGRFVAHELGHNLEWRHAAGDSDNDGVIQPENEYDDESGIMGWPMWAQANAPHRDQLQWFDAYPDALIRTDCSGTFELHALELDPGVDAVGTRVVKIRKRDTDDYYYLSYRRQIGPYPSHADYADKINIHRYDGNWSRTYHITNLEQNSVFQDSVNGITVTATSAGGATATVKVDIRNAAPEASFSHAILDGHLSVQFTNDSIDDYDNIVSYLWEMDGKTFTDKDTNYTFPDSGTYPVKLTVTDDCGNSHDTSYGVVVVANNPPTADFSFTADHLVVQFTNDSNDSDGNIKSSVWDFGDGATSEEASPSHTYAQSGTYEVTLTVTDDDGDTGQMPLTIQVEANKPPEANVTFSANGLNLQFTGTSNDPDGNIAAHLWDFGDGFTSTDKDPRHTYASAGTYTVELTVTDNHGATDTASKQITVDDVNVPPVAAFSFTTDGLEIQFSDTSTDSDGNIVSHQWDFGDHGTSTETSPIHTFASAGTYTVKLTVTDDDGETNTFTENIDAGQISPLVVSDNPGGGGSGGCFIRNVH
jgi:PKD repeat protein